MIVPPPRIAPPAAAPAEPPPSDDGGTDAARATAPAVGTLSESATIALYETKLRVSAQLDAERRRTIARLEDQLAALVSEKTALEQALARTRERARAMAAALDGRFGPET